MNIKTKLVIKYYMNKIWLFMMISGILVLLYTNPSQTLSTMISASTSTVELCINLCAVYAVWLGFIEIIEQSGLSNKLAKLLRPIIKKLFKIDNEEIEKMIALNLSANMLGLGNASTPMGIKAMKALDDKSGTASFPMIMLLILNTTSLQLLPTTIMGLRASSGSLSPSDIILPTIIASVFCITLSITLVKLCESIRNKKRKGET